MNETTDSPQATIVGKITPWFTKRMVMLLAMFFGFSAYFFYDWKIGYPKKRVIYDTYLVYESEWEALEAGGKDVEAKKLEWVEEATNKEWELNLNSNTLEPKDKIDDAKIAEQLYFAIGTGVLSLGVLVYFLLALRKRLEVDGEAVQLPNGKRVPYSAIKKVDTRRWGNKGLATITFDDGASLRGTAKIDGLKFGGFVKPEPYQADLILNRIIENFHGDLIELEEIEGEESEGAKFGEEQSGEAESEASGDAGDEASKSE